jgi:hypothetical protein
MEVVHHEEAAFIKIVVQALGFLVGKGPGVDVDSVDPRIVEEMVAFEIGDVERRRRVDAGQTAQGNQAIVVGLGIIPGPTAVEAAIAVAGAVGVARIVLEPAPIKLRRHARTVRIVVSRAAELEPSALHRKEREQERDAEDGPHQIHS